MSERRLYELVNPSDPITFRATLDEAVVLAAIMSASMYFVHDAETGDTPDGDAAGIRDAIWRDAERKASYANAFRSFLIGTRSEHELFETAVSRMTPVEAAAYREQYHDRRRSSMNDICARLWDAADAIDAKPVEAPPNHKDEP